MSLGLVSKLLKQFQQLEAANSAFADALRQDVSLPFMLPERPGCEDREVLIKSMTQLWKPEPGDTLIRAGIVCGSSVTINAANKLNKSKDDFKKAVQAVRNSGNSEKTRIDVLIDRLLQQQDPKKRKRTEELTIALRRAELNRLDLVRCYTHVRVLEKNLRSMSYTWAKTHAIIYPVKMQEAITLAKNLSNEKAKAVALQLLAALEPNTVLAYKKSLPNQLRANLVYFVGDTVERKAITISGPVLSPDPGLPSKVIWREDPGDVNPAVRLTRTDAMIENEPYVKALNLYLYNHDIR